MARSIWWWIVIARGVESAIMVICVGDSITQGSGASNDDMSYPSQAQDLLGGDYEVKNFGRGGRTMMASTGKAYVETDEYEDALSSSPDYVVIGLGTNDAKEENWRGISNAEEEFRNKYNEFIAAFEELESSPNIIVLIPPLQLRADEADGDWPDPTIVNQELPAVIREITASNDVHLLDLRDLFERVDGDIEENDEIFANDDLYDDIIHPNDEGYKVMAMRIRSAVVDWSKPTYSPTDLPTYEPTATYEPTRSPVIPFAPTPGPTRRPTFGPTPVPVDDAAWYKRDEPSKDCAWVGNHLPRCGVRGEDGRAAYEACGSSCATDAPTSSPSDTRDSGTSSSSKKRKGKREDENMAPGLIILIVASMCSIFVIVAAICFREDSPRCLIDRKMHDAWMKAGGGDFWYDLQKGVVKTPPPPEEEEEEEEDSKETTAPVALSNELQQSKDDENDENEPSFELRYDMEKGVIKVPKKTCDAEAVRSTNGTEGGDYEFQYDMHLGVIRNARKAILVDDEEIAPGGHCGVGCAFDKPEQPPPEGKRVVFSEPASPHPLERTRENSTLLSPAGSNAYSVVNIQFDDERTNSTFTPPESVMDLFFSSPREADVQTPPPQQQDDASICSSPRPWNSLLADQQEGK
ncbi:hypothetical protein CTAYLR_004062 [Chrysophaeum taylorii]|uniref:SGNH hydrolase-type esterase domain-containing protein n=1 Tax=Chrysophaeum taylorii TaxID=2483200 RepID=A0AAD7XMZ1_9STRA|nr:hypothetical protein CTAYLR_004062 [Chrysophaeum taylorii]